MRLNTLRAEDKLTFDVFLKVNDKYLHYTHNSDSLEAERLKKLKKNGVKKLFIVSKDEDSYLAYLELGLDKLNEQSRSIADRGALAQSVMVMAAENAEKSVETKEAFEAQKNQFNKISQFIISDKNAIKNMLSEAGISVDSNQHAANVSSLSIALASKAGILDKMEIFEIGIAGLLHDIGKKRQKVQITKPMKEMSPQELKIFKQHPQDGVDMLAGKPYISPRILGLVLSHEEFGEARGFPEKKFMSKQPLSYQIISLVNSFDHFASEKNLRLSDAAEPYYELNGQHINDELFTILVTFLS